MVSSLIISQVLIVKELLARLAQVLKMDGWEPHRLICAPTLPPRGSSLHTQPRKEGEWRWLIPFQQGRRTRCAVLRCDRSKAEERVPAKSSGALTGHRSPVPGVRWIPRFGIPA